MNKLSCIAIDDEPIALSIIRNYVAKTDLLDLIASFDDVLKAEIYLQNNEVDLLFLDIDMPDKSGLALIKDLQNPPLFILTTAYKDYALDAFDLSAVDFLLKPFSIERFIKAVNKAKELFAIKQQQKKNLLSIYVDYKVVLIDTTDIEFIESLSDYVIIHLKDNTQYKTLSTLKAIEEKLPNEHFLKVHRSYIVAIDAIQSYSNRQLQLIDIQIPVGTTYIKDVSEFIKGN